MELPEITVTMPAYNRAPFIGQAIESVQQQTLSCWELVIVDDCSTDATLEVAQSYASSDPRIRVYRNEHNLGVGHTRNLALARSTGRFITPLDSDDWYEPTRLERLLCGADQYNADVLSDDLLVVRDGDHGPSSTLSEICAEPLSEAVHIDMAGLLRRLGIERDGIVLGLTKPLIGRQFLIDHRIAYDPTLSMNEDYWMLADCLAAGARFVMIPDALYNYRAHAQQTTKVAASAADILSTIRRLEEFLNSDAAADQAIAAANARYHLGRMRVLLSYDSFAHSVKSSRLDKAAWTALREPTVVREFMTRLPLAVERRRRARSGDEFAYDPLFGPHRSRRVPEAPPAPPDRVGEPRPVQVPVSRPDGVLRRWRLDGLRFARSQLRG